MPEVIRGSRPSLDVRRIVGFGPNDEGGELVPVRPSLSPHDSHGQGSDKPRKSVEFKGLDKRRTDRPEDRPPADAYYDSRAATKYEFKRRGSTLAEYYQQHPKLLPQLPFTWHHGWRRVKLGILITFMFIDACIIPIILYYTMTFAGHVEGWIVFAVVATIWGGPTYGEFAIRSWRLVKKEDFYRPLGTRSRWTFDFVHWVSVFSIGSVTVLLIVGSAPHVVWLRVLSLPGPALLICLGGSVMFVTILSLLKKPAPFRISSTAKGEPVMPGVFYIVEDVAAVNANAGRPFREALHARYHASPCFRRMMMNQSLFWGIPAVLLGGALIVVACVHEVKNEVAYGLGWGIPFFWALIWAFFSVLWVKRDMQRERIAWEEDNDPDLDDSEEFALEDRPSPPKRDRAAMTELGSAAAATAQVGNPSAASSASAPSRGGEGHEVMKPIDDETKREAKQGPSSLRLG